MNKAKYTKNGILGNIGFLVGGTALAQVITFFATLYLTKLYLPEDFGLLSLLTSVVSLLAPISSMRYNKAILLAQDNKEQKALLYLSVGINLLLFLVLSIIALILWVYSDFFGLSSYTNFFWVVPLSVLFFGFTNIFQSYNEKISKFKLTSVVVLAEAVSKTFFQFILYTVIPKFGLLIGYISGLVLNTIIYVVSFAKKAKKETNFISSVELKKAAKKHDKFPKYFTWSNMIDSASQNICSITFPFLFTLEALGNFSIAFKIVRLPAILIAMATRRVYYPRAAELFQKDKKRFFELYKKYTLILILVSLFPALILEWSIPHIFKFFFNENWMASIPFAQIILVYVFFNFINSLAHENMLIFGLQKSFLMAEALWMILSLLLIYFAYLKESALLAVVFYVVSGIIMEALIFTIQYRKGRQLAP